MKNFVQKGEVIDFTNSTGSAIASGDVVIKGKIVGVAHGDIAANGGIGAVAISGVFRLALVASLAITAGDRVYWDSTGKVVTKTATDSPLGYAVTSQSANDATVDVLIVPGGSEASVAADVTALTDNSGGTADGTLEDCNNPVTGVDGTGSDAASKVDVDARLVSIANNFADLSAKQNAVLTALKNAGLMA